MTSKRIDTYVYPMRSTDGEAEGDTEQMVGTYTVNVGNGETVEMSGNPDYLDRITHQMRHYETLIDCLENMYNYHYGGPEIQDKEGVDDRLKEMERLARVAIRMCR